MYIELPSKDLFAKKSYAAEIVWDCGPNRSVFSSFSWSMNRICGFFVLWADQPSFSLVRQLIKEGWQYLGGWDTLAQGTEGGGCLHSHHPPMLEELSCQQTSLVMCEGSRSPSREPLCLPWCGLWQSMWQVETRQGEGIAACPCLNLKISLFPTEPIVREGRPSLALRARCLEEPQSCRQSLVVCHS